MLLTSASSRSGGILKLGIQFLGVLSVFKESGSVKSCCRSSLHKIRSEDSESNVKSEVHDGA